ncbi:MAG: esterase-like activity of phytase family protein [Pseudomonadota bacterium]
MRRVTGGIALWILGVTAATDIVADPVFNRIASFPVPLNLPADMDQATETSAEIIAATEDGMTLVYTDSPLEAVGMIDISDPRAPAAAGIVRLNGEPTSVVVANGKAFVGVNTSESYTEPSGHLTVVDIATKSAAQTCDLGGQPDSVAMNHDSSMLAFAIENERNEDLNDGVIPQLPAGNVTIIPINAGAPDCAAMIVADVTGLADVAGNDPEPEFVDFNRAGEIVVTLQENNHIAIIDSATGIVKAHFSAGSVDLTNVDLDEERALTFDGNQRDRAREPDAVKWIDDNRFVTADEGDYHGGSRTFTIFNKDGSISFDPGLSFEYLIARVGHYPERRSANKGVEPEGVETATYGEQGYIFVSSERGSIIGVYKDTGASPDFVQLLPSGIGPEGLVAIPERNLFVVANEVDLIDDGGVRAHVMLFELAEGVAAYPTLISGVDDAGRPVGWGALSGLAADPEVAGKLYAVNDSFYGLQPTIFTIDATQTPAAIVDATRVTRAGYPAQKLDMEGIVADGEGGFWIASEGRTDRTIPHALYHVNADGEIDDEIGFPDELLNVEKRFGSEGITKIGEGEDMTLWIAIQREWRDDEDGFVKLVSYNPVSTRWGAVRYPLQPKGAGWVGLSEITAHGDYVYIVERDNQIGQAAALKKLYRVPLGELQPSELGGDLPMVTKEEVRDFIPDLKAFGGYVVDKVEGFAIDAAGDAFAVTDNDGVDDSSGETFFLKLGPL